ncbi:MAG: PAS domain S-box protein [Methanoregula sp.]|nr:MAG: PAS domain S-box protein [Methanoregula sp.]
MLLIEDEDAHAELICHSFSQYPEKFHLFHAATLQDAKRQVAQEPFDLIIADWLLPNGKGIDIQPADKDAITIPVIIMTSHGNEELAAQMFKAGAVDYIVKSEPAFKDLPRITERAIREWENIKERKTAEKNLRESEEHYRGVFENTGTATVIIEEDTTISLANDEFCRLCGWRKEEIEGKRKWTEFVVPEDLDRMLTQHRLRRELGQKALKHYEFRFVTKSRKIRDIYLTVGLIRGTKRSVASLMDITERKQAIDEIFHMAQEWKRTFDATNDAIWILDRDQTVMRSNKTAERFFGRPSGEIIGSYCFEIVHGTKQPISECPFLRVKKSLHRETMDLQVGRKWFEISVDPILDEAGEFSGAVHIVSDITERKKVQEALRESEARYRNVVDAQTEFICRFRPDGSHVFANKAYCRYFGLNCEEIIGKKFSASIHPDDKERFRKLFVSLTAANPVAEIEHRIILPDGSICWMYWIDRAIFDEKGHIMEYQSVGRDITERKRAEEALTESEKRLQLTLDATNDGLWDWDIPSGNAIFSPRWYTMLGYENGEMPANYSTFKSLVHPDDLVLTEAKIQEHIQKRDDGYSIELRMRTKTGDWKWILTRGQVVSRDADGNALRMVGTHTDITDRKMMEEEIRSLNAALEQRIEQRTAQLTSSIEDKEVLLREVHHRVKNNLQIIISLLNLQSRYLTDEKTLAAIKESQNRVRAMALVHEKLYQSADISKINLDEYVRFLGNSLFQFYGMKGKGITFTTAIPEITLDINTAIPIGLITNELVSNSLKYAFPDRRKGEISITIHRKDRQLTILFKDNGVGLPEDFDWRTAKSLGLRLVISLVEQLQGTIELDRTTGMKFTIVVKEKE